MSAEAQPEFDAFAEDYDRALGQGLSVSGESKDFFAEQRILWLKRRLDAMEFAPLRILDFGCGTGSAAPYFRLHFPGARLVGTDVSARSIEQARRQHAATGARFAVHPGYRPDEPFDLAFCNGVFHHIPPSERADAVRYIADALTPGGLFAFWENNPWNPGTRMVMRRIPFDRDAITLTPPEARRLLRAGGLRVLRTDALFLFPRALRGLRFVEPWFAPLPLGAQYMVLAQRPDSSGNSTNVQAVPSSASR